eukprot:EG_transcript_17699
MRLGFPHRAAGDAIECIKWDARWFKGYLRLALAYLAMGAEHEALGQLQLAGECDVQGQERVELARKHRQLSEVVCGTKPRASPAYQLVASQPVATQGTDLPELTTSWSSILVVDTVGPLGRQVVAARDIAAGEVILADSPIISAVFDPCLCALCTRKRDNLLPCGKCGAEFYCSERCRDVAWDRYHAQQCGPMARRLREHRGACWRDGLPIAEGYAVQMAVRLVGMAQAAGLPDLPAVQRLCRLTDRVYPEVAAAKRLPFSVRRAQYQEVRHILGDEVPVPPYDFSWYDDLWLRLAANVIAT